MPGFSDSGTLSHAIGKKFTVFEGNLQIFRWIVRIQAEKDLKVKRVVYFLPVRGALEKADGTLQEELKLMDHFFGPAVFNNMVVIATNYPKKKYQALGFDEEEVDQTKRVFHLAMKEAIGNNSIGCPPIVYLGLDDNDVEVLEKLKTASVLNDEVLKLEFTDDVCSRCTAKVRYGRQNDKLGVIDPSTGTLIPYDQS